MVPVYKNEEVAKVEKFIKYDKDKPQMSLIPWKGLLDVGKVGSFGAKKYSKHNWKLCEDPDRYLDAAIRHIAKHNCEGLLDMESSLPHIAHAVWNLLAYMELYKENNNASKA